MAITSDFTSGLTAEWLRELLTYDPKTGVFRRRIRRGRFCVGSIAGSLEEQGYWCIRIGRRSFKAHRLAWLYVHGDWPPDEIDHKDLVRHHNWIENLRCTNQTGNNANRMQYCNNRSGLKGVHRHQGRWRAMIRINKKGYHIGSFDTAEEAHAAYCAKAREFFGEFANTGE